jgi:hypothetical protein
VADEPAREYLLDIASSGCGGQTRPVAVRERVGGQARPPTNAATKPFPCSSCTQGGVRRREGRAHQQGEPDTHTIEERERQQLPQADRQWQPDPQQPKTQAQISA